MAEFERATIAAIPKYEKKASNDVIEHSILLSELERRKRILYNQSGTSFEKRLRVEQATLYAMADMEALQFARTNPYAETTLPWREYRMQNTISDKEKEMVKGNEALIQIWANRVRDLREDFRDKLNVELFVDGNATGNTKKLHGLESIFGASACTSANSYTSSSETYAGLTLAAAHGTWSSTTPYSPHLVNENATAWGTWGSSPLDIARRLISACTIRNSKSARPDMLLTTETRYLQFLDALQAEERIMAHSPTPEKTYSGFKAIEFDGIQVLWDYDCTASCTYCLNLDQMEFRVLKPQLLAMRSAYDITRNAHLTELYLYGNLWIHPRYQGKSKNYG
jgi:hypothetical protein